jgi:hypothetical protein
VSRRRRLTFWAAAVLEAVLIGIFLIAAVAGVEVAAMLIP